MSNRIVNLYKKSFQNLSKEIWLLSGVTLINRAGTMVIPFLTIFLTKELGFTLSQAGVVMACYGVGSLIGTWAGGKITDSKGYYFTMYWSLILSGVLFIGLLFIKTYLLYCFYIFLLSAVADSFRPALYVSIDVYSKPENHTRSISLVRLAINLGFSVGPAVGGILAAYFGYDWLFILDGISCIVAGLYFRSALRQQGRKDVEKPKEVLEKRSSPYLDGPYLGYVLGLLLIGFVFMQLFFAMPVYLEQDVGMTEDAIGILLALNGFFIFLTEMPIIYLLEKKDKMMLLIIGTAMFGLAFYCFNIFPTHWMVAVLVVTIMTFAEIIVFPFANTIAMDRAQGKNKGDYMALFSMGFSGSHILAPVVGMYIAEHYGFSSLWTFTAIIGIVTVIWLWILKSRLSPAVSSNLIIESPSEIE